MAGKQVRNEIQYAAPRLERMLERRVGDEPFARRRRAVAERALARI